MDNHCAGKACGIYVPVGDPEKKVVDNKVFHKRCWDKLPQNTRVRTPEMQLNLSVGQAVQ